MLQRRAETPARRIPGVPSISPGDRQTTVLRPINKLITNTTRNTKNKIFAIPAALAAIPPNPNTAAINAITRKIQAYPSITYLPPF